MYFRSKFGDQSQCKWNRDFFAQKIINIEKRYTEDEIKEPLIRTQVKDFIL